MELQKASENIKTEVFENNRISRSSIYRAKMTSQHEKKFFVFDTSTFLILQSYLEDYGYEIIDLPISKLLKERSEALRAIADAINLKMCYVTKNILNEILEEEEKGAIRKGTARFIEQYFNVIDNEAPLPEDETWENMLRARTDEKEYPEKYYKLIWDSMKLLEGNIMNVFIVTLIEDFITLGHANEIEVVSPWRIHCSV